MSSLAANTDSLLAADAVTRWTHAAQGLSACAGRLRHLLTRRAAEDGLNPTEWELLWCCRCGPPQGAAQRDLAASIDISPAQVSGLIDRLRVRGLVVGRRPEGDRRRQLWRLTSLGHEYVDRVARDLATSIAALERHWPPNRMERLVAELDRLVNDVAAAECPLRPYRAPQPTSPGEGTSE